MKDTVIVYYSLEGTTDKVANILADYAAADTLRLTPKKEPPKSGFGKFAVGGFQAIFQPDPKIQAVVGKLADYKNVVIAYPVWAGTYPPAIGYLIDQGGLLRKNVYLIATSGSGNAKASFGKAKRKLASVGVRDTLSLTGPDKKKIRQFAEKNGLIP